MNSLRLISVFAWVILSGCNSKNSTSSPSVSSSLDDKNYIPHTNATMQRSAAGDKKVAEEVGGDLANVMLARAERLYPEVAASMHRAPGRQMLAPQVTYMTPPVYPMAYRVFGTEAEIWVAFIVGRDGSVLDAKPLSDLESLFTSPAIDAVKQWKFRPGAINGIPSDLLVVVPIRFELKK